MNRKPLIVHVLYRLDIGGTERMLVTLINRTQNHYRHAVVCLEGYGALRDQIQCDDVRCLALNKRPGKDWRCYVRLWKALRGLKPDLVHTYNYGTLDVAPIAKLAGVRYVVHAERGRSADPHGNNRKYRLLRRALLPFVDCYVTVSLDLRNWLVERVGVPPEKVLHIPNGIDVAPFAEAARQRGEGRPLLGWFAPLGAVVIGTVGRLVTVKGHAGLIAAFQEMCEALPGEAERMRLVLIGDGPQRRALEEQISHAGLSSRIRLLGKRTDIAALLAEFDVFAFSSIYEGMPGAVLEAMASMLPVAATDVGGVGEVVANGVTGILVPAQDPQALAKAMADYVMNPDLRKRHGNAGYDRTRAVFSLDLMLSRYVRLYDGLLERSLGRQARIGSMSRASGREEQ